MLHEQLRDFFGLAGIDEQKGFDLGEKLIFTPSEIVQEEETTIEEQTWQTVDLEALDKLINEMKFAEEDGQFDHDYDETLKSAMEKEIELYLYNQKHIQEDYDSIQGLIEEQREWILEVKKQAG